MGIKPVKWLIFLCSWIFQLNAYADDPNSLSLQEAIRFALQNNPKVISFQKKKQAAEAEIRIEGQRNNPNLVAEDTRSQPNYFVGAGYLFELGGKRSKRIEIAKNEAAVSGSEYSLQLLSLRHDVRVEFYEVLDLQQKQKEMGISRDLANRLQNIAQQRFDAGEIARFEVLEAELEAKRRENEWKKTEAEMRASRIEFNALLNRNLQDSIQLKGSLEDRPQIPAAESMVQGALARHFELQSLQQQIKAEEARLRLARAERIPDLDMEAGTEIHDAEFQYGWRAALTMELPLLNRHAGEIARSQFLLEGLKAQESATQIEIRSKISSAYLRYEAALFQEENYRKEVLPVAIEIEQLSEESYREGKTGILSVLDAQRNIRQVRLEYLDVLLEFQNAIADLELAASTELP